jgi:hypothetical protein
MKMSNSVRVGIAVAALCTGLVTTTGSAQGAERNYEAYVCAKNTRTGYLYANVGGYNQHGKYVHTPNFGLYDEWPDDVVCGEQSNWWFKPRQTLTINAYNTRTHKWVRFYKNFKQQCWVVRSTSRYRECDLNFVHP